MSLLPHRSKVMSVSVCLGDRWWVLMGRIGGNYGSAEQIATKVGGR